MDRYPLTWPNGWKRTPNFERAVGRFGTKQGHYKQYITIAQAIERILDELYKLGVTEGDAIISTNLKTKLNGLPYSNQSEPDDPGVAVYWKTFGDENTKVMAIDRYDRVADNLAAIAATLSAMRAIERHGGAQILDRAFTGFDALPGPQDRDWRAILKVNGKPTLDEAKKAYRKLSFERHPDHGGSEAMMCELNWAWDQAQRELL